MGMSVDIVTIERILRLHMEGFSLTEIRDMIAGGAGPTTATLVPKIADPNWDTLPEWFTVPEAADLLCLPIDNFRAAAYRRNIMHVMRKVDGGSPKQQFRRSDIRKLWDELRQTQG